MKKKYIILTLLLVFTTTSAFATFPSSFSAIVKNEKNKIVHVFNTFTRADRNLSIFDDLFQTPILPQKRTQVASGSGFFVSKDGYILTNNHVIEGADSLEVILFNEVAYPAKLIGSDVRTDLALIKIEIRNAPFVRFGDSDKLEIGDWVVAIGNPIGLDFTVTAGILSAKNRDIFRGTAYGTFLQTDAAINQGNSGGPLFNINGEVIGINTAISAQGQGLGFAIPSNLAVKIMEELKEHGEISRGWLGVGIQNVTAELSSNFQLPKGKKGVAITGVQIKSPAENAGLQRGDVIVKYNGHIITKTSELQQNVAETKVNTTVAVQVYRSGKLILKKVKIVSTPQDLNSVKFNTDSGAYGVLLTPLTRQIRNRRGIKKTEGGLFIQRIEKGGLAEKNDLRVGDVILEVNAIKMRNILDFSGAITNTKKTQALLLILRNNEKIFRSLPTKK